MEFAVTCKITELQNRGFAKLSGDINPLHVDPLAARRMLFGTTVIHGVHVLLRVIGALMAECGDTGGLKKIKARFLAPIQPGQDFEVAAKCKRQGEYKITVHTNGKKTQTITLHLETVRSDGPLIPHGVGPANPCRTLSFDTASKCRGTTALFLDRDLLEEVGLINSIPPWQMAAILATTRVVGMECPGLNSLFTGLSLNFSNADVNVPTALFYQVSSANKELSFLTIDVHGPGMDGSLTSIYRPEPITQAAYATIQETVDPEEFQGQTAMIIGGSRGLGEVTAKCLAAGGGEVCITYHSGSADADRVSREIVNGGGRCRNFQFNVLGPIKRRPEELPNSWQPDHLFVFATPFISVNTSGQWDDALFTRYRDYYVDGFKQTVDTVRTLCNLEEDLLKVVYPSTIFIDQPEPGLDEYTKAKAEGEEVCQKLEKTHPKWRFFLPRLPRLLTDQTNAVLDVEASDTVATILQMLRDIRTDKTAPRF